MKILKTIIREFIFSLTAIILKTNFRVTVKGLENIPSDSKVLIVANHASYLDVFLVGTALFHQLINIRWVISAANYRIKALQWFYWVYQVIVAEKGTVGRVIDTLNQKKWVMIFPEGDAKWVVQKDNEPPKKLGKGAAAIALSTGVTILPIGITGADRALAPISFKVDKRHPITVTIGKVFHFDAVAQEKMSSAMLEEKVTEIMVRVNDLVEGETHILPVMDDENDPFLDAPIIETTLECHPT